MDSFAVPPILYYHRVSPETHPDAGVTPGVFRKQMSWLSRLGFRGVTLADALSAAGSSGRGGRCPIAITFDDGYLDNYTYAAPILEEFGFRATIYFVALKMGERVDWTSDPVWKDHPLMDRRLARELVSRGFEAGSHTLTHPDLSKLSDRDARKEIEESRARLADTLSASVTTFCYPYGSYTENCHPSMVREAGYAGARTVHRYRFSGHSDRYRLACRPVSGRMGLPRFFLTAGAYRLGMKGEDVRD
jgi:peptidoglycan/xylan/chitin deacetylase (PgdA/CDA1 family)